MHVAEVHGDPAKHASWDPNWRELMQDPTGTQLFNHLIKLLITPKFIGASLPPSRDNSQPGSRAPSPGPNRCGGTGAETRSNDGVAELTNMMQQFMRGIYYLLCIMYYVLFVILIIYYYYYYYYVATTDNLTAMQEQINTIATPTAAPTAGRRGRVGATSRSTTDTTMTQMEEQEV